MALKSAVEAAAAISHRTDDMERPAAVALAKELPAEP